MTKKTKLQAVKASKLAAAEDPAKMFDANDVGTLVGKLEESPDILIVEDGPTPKQLTKAEMLELRALHAEARVVQLEIQLQSMQRDALLKQIDPEGKLAKFASALRVVADKGAIVSVAQRNLKTFIEARLGIKDLGLYAYDEDTGSLTQPEQ